MDDLSTNHSESELTLTVWGLGHVGLVTAASLISKGHRVVGIDVDDDRIRSIRAFSLSTGNPQLTSVIRDSIKNGKFLLRCYARDRPANCVADFVCVDALTRDEGGQVLDSVQAVLGSVSEALRAGQKALIVIRTTILPETADLQLVPLVEGVSGLRDGRDFHLIVNPSFIRGSDFEEDLLAAERIVVGAPDKDGPKQLMEIYRATEPVVFVVDRRDAELVKYLDNAFHALKVSFANEAATLAYTIRANASRIMEIIAADSRLNASSAYLKPGAPYDGRCLPKDVDALTTFIQEVGVHTPVLSAIKKSNDSHGEQQSRSLTESGVGAPKPALQGTRQKAAHP
jgi:GDP-mannose 6-dehydrogenase